MYPVARTYKGMTHGMTELMTLTRSRGWSHHGNPVAEWCFDAVEVRHPPGEPDLIRPDKPERGTNRTPNRHRRDGDRRMEVAWPRDQEVESDGGDEVGGAACRPLA
ncbi:hypothetical protein GCM10010492_67030 [Saccharothrix mutabilis subsp. mutabilis]|uniref:Transposase n=1 Tax=Saccharothrix mutabilis subsp. mutabilis TaxID=66855 RepID=A0ABP3EA23_9PSEU